MLDPSEEQNIVSRRSSNYPFEITHHSVRLINLPPSMSGIRIVQLSDLHRRHDIPDSLLEATISHVNSMQPDYVALTGDYINSNSGNILPVLRILSHIHIRGKVYSVMGNHDYPRGHHALPEGMQNLGFHVLMNESARIGENLWIAGVDDMIRGNCMPEKALDGIPYTDPVILLSHNPDVVSHIPPDRSMLILSGHTHGGQYKLPILTPKVICRLHLRTRFIHGWYRFRNIQVYVNRGIGVSGWWITAKRHFCDPEISEFTLYPQPPPMTAYDK